MSDTYVTRFLRNISGENVLYDPELEREVVVFDISNLGGITFHFGLDYTYEKPDTGVKYSFAQCHSEDNFNRKRGTAQAKESFAKGDVITITKYDPELSLIENAYNDLCFKAKTNDPVFVEKKLYRLKTAMRKIHNKQQLIITAAEQLDTEWE